MVESKRVGSILVGDVEGEGFGRWARSSERRRSWYSGWVARRYVVQVKADAVVSWLEDVSIGLEQDVDIEGKGIVW